MKFYQAKLNFITGIIILCFLFFFIEIQNGFCVEIDPGDPFYKIAYNLKIQKGVLNSQATKDFHQFIFGSELQGDSGLSEAYDFMDEFIFQTGLYHGIITLPKKNLKEVGLAYKLLKGVVKKTTLVDKALDALNNSKSIIYNLNKQKDLFNKVIQEKVINPSLNNLSAIKKIEKELTDIQKELYEEKKKPNAKNGKIKSLKRRILKAEKKINRIKSAIRDLKKHFIKEASKFKKIQDSLTLEFSAQINKIPKINYKYLEKIGKGMSFLSYVGVATNFYGSQQNFQNKEYLLGTRDALSGTIAIIQMNPVVGIITLPFELLIDYGYYELDNYLTNTNDSYETLIYQSIRHFEYLIINAQEELVELFNNEENYINENDINLSSYNLNDKNEIIDNLRKKFYFSNKPYAIMQNYLLYLLSNDNYNNLNIEIDSEIENPFEITNPHYYDVISLAKDELTPDSNIPELRVLLVPFPQMPVIILPSDTPYPNIFVNWVLGTDFETAGDGWRKMISDLLIMYAPIDYNYQNEAFQMTLRNKFYPTPQNYDIIFDKLYKLSSNYYELEQYDYNLALKIKDDISNIYSHPKVYMKAVWSHEDYHEDMLKTFNHYYEKFINKRSYHVIQLIDKFESILLQRKYNDIIHYLYASIFFSAVGHLFDNKIEDEIVLKDNGYINPYHYSKHISTINFLEKFDYEKLWEEVDIQAKTIPVLYKITEDSLSQLKKNNIQENTIAKLKVLLEIEYTCEEEFMAAIEFSIGKNRAMQYKEIILESSDIKDKKKMLSPIQETQNNLIKFAKAKNMLSYFNSITYNDVAPNSFCDKYIKKLIHYHVDLKGYSDGTFRPENPVSIGEFCKIVYQALFPEEFQVKMQQPEYRSDQTLSKYIYLLSESVSSNDLFDETDECEVYVDKPIKRKDAAKVIAKILIQKKTINDPSVFNHELIPKGWDEYSMLLKKYDIINGYFSAKNEENLFGAEKEISRAEFAKVIVKAIEKINFCKNYTNLDD
ncbi:S-layer protein [Candidatus Magnetomorum sp. HK-1]|nr:S-layer protein [Candidatus Magnetomorum sp. HK-1]